MTWKEKMILPYEWILENVGQEPMTIASKMISFRGEKVFRVGLKNLTDMPILFLVAIDLRKMGMKVKDVKFGMQGSGLSPARMEEMTKEDLDDEGSLQLFTATPNEKIVGNRKVMFRICIGETNSGYCYRLSDRLAKDQLWAALRSQPNLADVELIVKDKSFPVHKAILAARSPVFADEFEKVQPEVPHQIRLDGVEPSTVEKFLHFIYTGEPMGTLEDEVLLKLAVHYHLSTLASLCHDALKTIDALQIASILKRLNDNDEQMSSSKIM
jgi:speckle-type POZ protein